MQKNPSYSITRSISKKVQIKQYEPEEYFSSRTYYFDEMPTEEQKQIVSVELFKECQSEINQAVKDRKRSLAKEDAGQDAPY